MPTKDTSSSEDPKPRKRRKHGYRGYPNNPTGGGIHSGSGFGGAGALSGPGGAGLPDSGVLTERTREDVEETEEEEK